MPFLIETVFLCVFLDRSLLNRRNPRQLPGLIDNFLAGTVGAENHPDHRLLKNYLRGYQESATFANFWIAFYFVARPRLFYQMFQMVKISEAIRILVFLCS